MIYLYCARIPDGFSPSDTAKYLEARFEGEENREYIKKIKNRLPIGASEGLFSLLLLSKMIDKHFPAARDRIPLLLVRADSGKPYLVGSNLKFSISHSKGLVACALSDSGEIGVDIEASSISPEKAKKLSARYFDHAEQIKVNGDPEKFTRLWTQKEATVKFFGENLAVFFKSGDKYSKEKDVLIHSFNYGEAPISLCTKRNFEKIIFCDLDCR